MKRLFFLATFCLAQMIFGQTNFVLQNSTVSSYIFDIEMVSITVGYAVGENGVILKTIDGGINWTAQNSGVTSDLRDCQFANENLGWVCGLNGVILKTTNGGSSWSYYSVGSSVELKQINIIGTIAGLVAGKDGASAAVYYTTDGGNNWNPFGNIPGGAADIQDIEFTSVTSGFVIDYFNLYYTATSGTSWDPIVLPTSEQTNRIEMYNANIGWICGGNGLMLKTINGGTNWQVQATGTTSVLFGMDVIDSLNVWACGFDGTIISTNNGGLTWTVHNTPVSYKLPAISAVSPDEVWACGEFGTILHNAQSDLQIQAYLGPTITCPKTDLELKIVVTNNSSVPITTGTFIISNNDNVLLEYDWSGVLGPGISNTISIGSISLIESANIKFKFVGDEVASGNELLQYIDVISDGPFGVSEDLETCVGSFVEISAYGGEYYYWHNASTDSTLSQQSVQVFEDTYYTVSIIQSQCTIKDTVFVKVENGDCAVTAFSPNGDGINDFLIIENLPSGSNTVTIFNRWGDEIAVIQNYNNTDIYWSGNDAAGNSLPENTFFYSVSTTDTNMSFSGWVQIVR